MKWIKGIIVVVIIIIILICAILLIRPKNGNNPENGTVNETYAIDYMEISPQIADESKYFDVEASAEKLVTYAQQKDSKAVLGILSKEYIEKNSLTEENVLEKINLSNIKKQHVKEIYQITRKRSL